MADLNWFELIAIRILRRAHTDIHTVYSIYNLDIEILTLVMKHMKIEIYEILYVRHLLRNSIQWLQVCLRIQPLGILSNPVDMKTSIDPATCDYDKIWTKFMKRSKLGNALEASWMVSGNTWVAAIAMPTSLMWKIGEHCRITTGKQVAYKVPEC